MRRAAVTALLAVAFLLGIGAPALAHNTLVGSDPMDEASLDVAPAEVVLTFDQPVTSGDVNQIAVIGPEGSDWTTGEVTVTRNEVRTDVAPLGPAGVYTIGYRILSADGHPVSGELTFTLTEAGEGSPRETAPDPTPGDDATDAGPVPVWVWIAGAVALGVAGLLLAMRIGRQ